MVDDNFSIGSYVSQLTEALKKIICIDEITIFKFSEGDISIHSTISNLQTANKDFLSSDLKKLKELCDANKMTDLNKIVNKLPSLAPSLKMFTNNFATISDSSTVDVGQGKTSVIYVFHFEFKSIRTILEKYSFVIQCLSQQGNHQPALSIRGRQHRPRFVVRHHVGEADLVTSRCCRSTSTFSWMASCASWKYS